MTVKSDRVQRSRKKQEKRLGKHEISHHFKPKRQLPHPISGECDDSISASAAEATFAEETSEADCQVMADIVDLVGHMER